MKTKRNKTLVVLLVSVLLIFTGAVCADLVQTDGGNVEIVDIALETTSGTLSMQMYRPDTYAHKQADTDDNGNTVYTTVYDRLPCVIAVHGNLDHKETQDIALVELSRRGIIVIAIDMYSHGHSSVAAEGQDILDVMDFVQTLDYVDKTKIGLTGHSLGAVLIQTQPAFSGRLSEISAILTTGWDVVLPEALTQNVHMGSVVAEYDEFFFYLNMLDENKEKLLVDENGRVLYNTVEEYNIARRNAFLQDAGIAGETQFNTIYRNSADKLRVVYQVASNHPWLHFSNETGRAMVEFFGQSFGMDFESATGISDDSMIWGLKAFFNAVSLVGFFMFVISFALTLIEARPFRSLKAAPVGADGRFIEDEFNGYVTQPRCEEPSSSRTERVFAAPDKPKTKLSAVLYALTMIILAALPGILYFPLATSGIFFEFEASPNDVSAAFPFEYPNHIITWAFFMAIILAAVFAVCFILERLLLKIRPRLSAKDTLASLGLTVKPRNIAKVILVPALTVFAAYALLGFSEYFFNADFRLYVLAVKTFPPQLIIHLFVYGWFFLLFFIVTGVINNAMARHGIKEWANLLVMCLCNVIGAVFVLAFYYLSFFANGIPMFNQSIAPVLLLPLIPLLCVTTISGRLLYKKCGNVYLPAILNTIIVTLITLSCTRFFFMG